MATNTLGGINLAAIADDAIDYLGSEHFPVGLFTTNLSKDIAQKGESVTTRIITGYTAQDVTGGYSANAQDSTSTAVTTSLDNFKGVPVEFKDMEITKAGNPDWLMKHFFKPLKEATIGALLGDLLALVTNTNFTNKTTQAVGGFDADTLADIRGALTTRKVMRKPRGMLLHPDYHTALSKDTSLSDTSASGDNAVIRDGVVTHARGFDIYEYEDLPENSENLKGFACGRSALVLAVRPVYKPKVRSVQVVNRVEPKTGLPFQFRIWYSPDNGKWYMSAGYLYGVSVGQAAALQRIVSA